MNPNAKLSDLLHGNLESLKNVWSTTEAAAESAPLPAGVYTARLLEGALCQSRSGTPGYKMTFEVAEGEMPAAMLARHMADASSTGYGKTRFSQDRYHQC